MWKIWFVFYLYYIINIILRQGLMQPRLSSNYIAKDDLKFLTLPLSGGIAGYSTMPGVAHWTQGFYACRASTLLAPHLQPPISSYSFLRCWRLNFPGCAWEVSTWSCTLFTYLLWQNFMQPRFAGNSQYSGRWPWIPKLASTLSVWITGICHYTQFMWCWGSNPKPHAC